MIMINLSDKHRFKPLLCCFEIHMDAEMKSKHALIFLLSILSLSIFSSTYASGTDSKSLTVSSPVLRQNVAVEKKYSSDGVDFSPAISWSPGPTGTKSFAIICTDSDAPDGTWWHWIIFNISPKTLQLQENVPKSGNLAQGVCQGMNDFHRIGYNGPDPPPGKLHHYEFKVMALDTTLALKPGCDKNAFKTALNGHVLAEGQLTGTYKR